MTCEMESKGFEWQRCSEGFAGLLKSDLPKKRKRSANVITNKGDGSGGGPGNIFEKLSVQGTDDTSQHIAWSSSESEDEVAAQPDVLTPHQILKRQTRQSSKPAVKRASPLSRLRNLSNRKKQKVEKTEDAAIEIQKSDSEDEVKSRVDHIDDLDKETKDTQASGTGTVKSSDLDILGYDSSQEEDSVQEQSTCQSTQSSPQIIESGSTASPPPPSSSSAAAVAVGVRASEWVKSLHLKTPKKSEQGTDDTRFEDSGKKKKQQRGGIADQLSRLQAREKSSVRMWGHQQTKSASQETKSVLLEVLGFDSLYSINIVRCKVCESMEPAAGTSQKLVMFPGEQFEQFNMSVGTQFRVFPPWQQLSLNDDQEIMMCTKYCKVTSRADDSGHTGHVTADTSHVTTKTGADNSQVVTARWKCPCVQGVPKDPTTCPAYQLPSLPGLVQEPHVASCKSSTTTSNISPQYSGSSQCASRSVHHSSHLHTVSASPAGRMGTKLFQTNFSLEEAGKEGCLSLLESIQKSRVGDTCNASHSSAVSFRGFIHRALMYCEKSKTHRCRLLVEDTGGCMCEIRLLRDTLGRQGHDLMLCVGKTFNFSGLTVLQRVTRDRDIGLFSLVDKLWSGKVKPVDSQDSDQSHSPITVVDSEVSRPGYCYLLEEESAQSVAIVPCDTNLLKPTEIKCTSLHSVHQTTTAAARYTVCVKLLHVHKTKNQSTCVLYVTDSSLNRSNNYTRVQVQSTCYLDNITDVKEGRHIIILRDLYCINGALVADGYTQILQAADVILKHPHLQEVIDSAGQTKLVLDSVQLTSSVDQMCTVKGRISDVDEESAYSWDECRNCHSEQLQCNQGLVQCVPCGNKMKEPYTRLKMEVIVQCHSPQIVVRVDLLQSTIERLLPQEDGDDEGYELNSVLNKNIGPLTCVVMATNVPEYSCVLQEVNVVS